MLQTQGNLGCPSATSEGRAAEFSIRPLNVRRQSHVVFAQSRAGVGQRGDLRRGGRLPPLLCIGRLEPGRSCPADGHRCGLVRMSPVVARQRDAMRRMARPGRPRTSWHSHLRDGRAVAYHCLGRWTGLASAASDVSGRAREAAADLRRSRDRLPDVGGRGLTHPRGSNCLSMSRRSSTSPLTSTTRVPRSAV